MSSCFLLADEEESCGKMSIDDLYEKKKNRDLKQLSIFNKILNRIHKRIKTTARLKQNDTHIFFNVPEFLFGEPCYDNANCIAYLISQLKKNGFSIRYFHPNTLLVSWDQYFPTYVRSQIKKKTGMIINEKGQHIGGAGFDDEGDGDGEFLLENGGDADHRDDNRNHHHHQNLIPSDDINAGILNPRKSHHNNHHHNAAKSGGGGGANRKYNPVHTYRPTGNLIYDNDYFDKIEKKVSFSL